MTTKREKKRDYEFFFKAIAKAVEQVTGQVYKPNCLVADAASEITNGFKNAFSDKASDFKRVVCYQHVKRNVEKHLGLMSKETKADIKVLNLLF